MFLHTFFFSSLTFQLSKYKLFPDSPSISSAQSLHKPQAEIQKCSGVAIIIVMDIKDSHDRSWTSIQATTLSSHRATDLQSS